MTGIWDFVQQAHNFIAPLRVNHVKLGGHMRRLRLRQTSWQSAVETLIDDP